MAEKLKILIVDDDEDVLKTTSELISLFGYDVTTADTGEQAIKMYSKLKHDLVIIDGRMPHMDGYSTFDKLKQLDPKINVVIMSAFVNDEKWKKCKNDGAVANLRKPFEPKEIQQLIAKLT